MASSNKTLKLAVAAIIAMVMLYLILPKSPIRDSGTSNGNTPRDKKCPSKEYTASDIRAHTSCSIVDPDANDLFLVIDGQVYDVSSWSKSDRFIMGPGTTVERGSGRHLTDLFFILIQL